MRTVNIKFKDIRDVISMIDNVSIVKKKDLSYENFNSMRDVPSCYDDLYVWGVGGVKELFPDRSNPNESYEQNGIEIIVNDSPKEMS